MPVCPFMRYSDAAAAIEWLCDVFGFRLGVIVEGEGDLVAHAELHLDDAVVMIGSDREDALGLRAATPGDPVTGGLYLTVDQVDDLCARARDAGAIVVTEPYDTDYGSRECQLRDPGGQLWSLGTYRPGSADV